MNLGFYLRKMMKKIENTQAFRVRGSLKIDTNKTRTEMVMATDAVTAEEQFHKDFPEYNVINIMSLDEMESSAAKLREFRDRMDSIKKQAANKK